VVSILWQIAKHILDARTHSRIVFLNTADELFQHLQPEAIPEAYGGKRRDDSGFCTLPETCVCEPTRLSPEEHFFRPDEWWRKETGSAIQWRQAVLKTGQWHEVPMEGCLPGDKLVWMFTVGAEIEFEVLVQAIKSQNGVSNGTHHSILQEQNGQDRVSGAKNDLSQLQTKEREALGKVAWPKITLTSLKCPEHGRLECKEEGVYCLRFRSESSSWLGANKLKYAVQIVRQE